MCEWKEKPLSDLAILCNDSWKVGDEKCPYIALEHIDEGKLRLNGLGHSDSVASNKYRFNENNFLFGKLRPYFRKVVRPQFSGICSTDIWVVGARGETDLTFLFYLFANQEFVDMAYSGSSGTRMPRADWKFMKDTTWLVPSDIEEQRAIASVLSSLDDKIDLLHRQNQTLEAMAETLFRQWFVEKAEEGTLGDVASFHNGKKRPDSIINGNIPIYGGNGILGYADKSNYEGVTIIVGRVGAYCGSLYIERNPVWISDNALVAKPISKEHSSFLFFLLKSLQLNEMAEGSSHPLLTQTLLKSMPIILPQKHLIEPFVYQADTWLDKIDKNNNQIRTLSRLRDTLLPKLMSGEVKVQLSQGEAAA